MKKIAYFSGETQAKIKKALSRFWQERFISLKTADSPTGRDFLLKNPFFLNSDHFVEDTAFPATNPALLNEALELAGFSQHILEQELISFSNGELRRLMLARNFMEEPDLWILDDPFGGLDPEYREFLRERIEKFQENGIEMRVNNRREESECGSSPARGHPKQPIECNGDLSLHTLDYQVKPDNDKKGGCHSREHTPRHSRAGGNPGCISANQNEPLFSLRNLNVSFGEKIVLKNLNWEVYKGEHWAITGANGSGKSTLLGILSGDHPQIYRNDLTLLGQNSKNGFSIDEHKKKIGFFSPEMALQTIGQLTAFDILIEHFPQPPLAEEKKQATALLNSLGLNEFANMHLSELSDENLRLILIARAILRKPQVIILDEPTQGMSETAREKLFSVLDGNSENSTLIFVTHYPNEFPKCINRVLRLSRAE
ncbi:hypothetical protein AGMMS49938_17140 [Fibrobacterales bacterium]|nr:hypothetical protein AGMMS49938_17140 [Fibrobacterales bacterium]